MPCIVSDAVPFSILIVLLADELLLISVRLSSEVALSDIFLISLSPNLPEFTPDQVQPKE